MNKQILVILLLLTAIFISIVFISSEISLGNKGYSNQVSNVMLLNYEEYKILKPKIHEGNPFNLDKVGNNKNTISIDKYSKKYISFSGNKNNIDQIIYVNPKKEVQGEKLEGISYTPENETYLTFYDKNIPLDLLISFDLTPEDKTNGNVYAEFGDGSCYYPVEFEKEEDPEICEGYLEETVEYLGYTDIDNMLLEVFGEAVRIGE